MPKRILKKYNYGYKVSRVENVAKKTGNKKKEMRRQKFHLWIIVANAARNWTPCYRLVHLGRALNNNNYIDDNISFGVL